MTRVSIIYIVGEDGPCFWFISDDDEDDPDIDPAQDVEAGPLDPDIDPC